MGQAVPADFRPLADQWAIHLTGPVAPAEVLARLACNVAPGKGDSLRSRLREIKALARSEKPTEPPSQASAGVATGHDRADAANDLKSNSEPSSQWTGWMPNTLSPLGDPPLAPEAPTHITPSVRMPTLPSLLPQQAPGLSLPPIAAAINRHGAREEAGVREDELSELSAKIKRILDEEARRHGIDV